MKKSKAFLVTMYISVALLVIIFVFGESGILDSMSQSQDIAKLVSLVNESQKEIDEMTKEYETLIAMQKPSQAFLVGQGRKTQNIIVFQQSEYENNTEDSLLIAQEQKLFFTIALIALIILLVGIMGIVVIYYFNAKQKKNTQEDKDHVSL